MMVIPSILPVLVLAAGAVTDQSHQRAKGRVSFAVDPAWVNIGGRGELTVGFQIPNPADEGTPDSANVAVSAATEAGGPFEASVERVSAAATVVSRLPKRANAQDALLLSSGRQGTTPYVLVDRLARRGSVEVHIRAAWPLLSGSTEEWQSGLVARVNRLMSDTTVDGKPLGSAGRLVEHTHMREGKPLRMIEMEE